MGTSKGLGRSIMQTSGGCVGDDFEVWFQSLFEEVHQLIRRGLRTGQVFWTARHLLAITVLVSLVVGSVYGATPAEEAEALETVLKNLNYPYYNASVPACTWNPNVVTCDPTSGLITALNLGSMGLSGTIHPQIGTFQSLILLDLTTYNLSLGAPNHVTGPLPDELGSLSQLKYFNFSFNIINSDFPPVLLKLTNLVDLRVDNANMTGVIPPQINQLKNLEHLFLGNNHLHGPFPAELGDLIHLKELTVWYNQFKDRIPDSLGNLQNLTYLNFHDCSMWGPLPASFGNMTSMQKLWLYNNDLTGSVPASWRNLTSALDLNIRKNSLSGPVPEFLAQIPSLKRLDVSQNLFTGPVPDTLSTSAIFLKSWNNTLVQNCDMSCNYFNGSFPLHIGPNINITGNCFSNSTKQSDFCQRDIKCDMMGRYYDANGCVPCPALQTIYDPANCLCGYADLLYGDKKARPIAAIAGGAGGAVVVLLVLIALWWYKPIDFKDPFQRKKVDYGPWDVPNGVQRYSLRELTKATNNWSESNEIGQGGFGKVFHGVFDDGKMVAIKRASDVSMQGTLEFRNEVLLLSRLHHRHLVRLEGFCDERDLQVLVYEFMENGNLHDLLTGVRKGRELSWQKRLEIAIGVAQGLDYLHSFADPPVIHRDIKPSNILLDADLIAKVADFGISKESLDFNTHVSTRPAGTAGYLDPEYFLRRQLTTASDVYAFGVCLLELITGQQSIDHMRLEEYNLVEWVKPRFKVGGVEDVVDTTLGEDYDKEVLKLMTEVALTCTAVSKNDRPTMKEVLNALEPHLSGTLLHDPMSISEKAKELSAREDMKIYSGKKSTDPEIRGGHSRGPSTHASINSPATTQYDIELVTPR